MRSIFMLLGLMLTGFQSVYTQISISDDFSDGDFSFNPRWNGDTAFYIVNQNLELQLNDTTSGERFLSTTSIISLDATWEFSLKMDFNPSGSNYCKLYLVCNKPNLQQPLQGYFVRIGGDSKDRISLFRQDGTLTTPLIESVDDLVDTDPVEVRVKVERSPNDNWKLFVATGASSTYQLLGSATDSVYHSSSFFGIAPKYTSTRSDKFYIDDIQIVGYPYQDTVPPLLKALSVWDSMTLLLEFNENVDSNTALDYTAYSLSDGLGKPLSAAFLPTSEHEVLLVFPNTIPSRRKFALAVSGVEDLFGNALFTSKNVYRYVPVPGDVVINELMVDPEPVIGIPPNALPDREYLEFYNRTEFNINLKNWQLTSGNNVELLPEFILAADTFVVIADMDVLTKFQDPVNLLGLNLPFHFLPNGGAEVSLVHPEGMVVSSVNYSDDWYDNMLKAQGGWSLEQIDPDNLCGTKGNWSASEDYFGGTPGRRNSILGENPDTSRPKMVRIGILGDSSIVLHLSETLNNGELTSADNYVLEPDLQISELELMSMQIEVHFSEPIGENMVYRISLASLPVDCGGNTMVPDTLEFAIPTVPVPGELIINEVLFNPRDGVSDFLEIFNNSKSYFDLSKIRLGNWDESLQMAVNLVQPFGESFLIRPGDYIVLTEAPDILTVHYNILKPDNILEVDKLPSLPDKEGTISITASSLEIIDHLVYSEDMHLVVLGDKEGVSLERLSPYRITQDEDNWHSAASTAGFATPGYQNSQFYGSASGTGIIIQPEVFTPNQDGYHDFLEIHYSFPKSGNIVSVSVWNSSGMELLKLEEHLTTGMKGSFTWDGTNNLGELMKAGIYILIFDYFNPDGTREVIRKTCVLSR